MVTPSPPAVARKTRPARRGRQGQEKRTCLEEAFYREGGSWYVEKNTNMMDVSKMYCTGDDVHL
jgi:hypothetical protein